MVSYQEYAAAQRATWSPEVKEFADKASAYFQNEYEKLRVSMAEPSQQDTDKQ